VIRAVGTVLTASRVRSGVLLISDFTQQKTIPLLYSARPFSHDTTNTIGQCFS
jgi:hypothetical protein